MFNINIGQNPKHLILICALVISVAASSLYEKFSNRLPAVCLERNHPISSIRLVVCGDLASFKAVIFLDPDLETYAEMVILFFFCVPFFSGFLG